MRLAKQVMSKKTGTEMWSELCSIYDGKTNSATKKVYRLNGDLHRIHLRANGDVRSHLYQMFEIKEQLKDLESPVNDLQMVDILLRSLPNQMYVKQ
ncbi:LOW QUALITY PROTEIN: Multidrug resistance protein ABC transporter [Phytophthora megakarya]|uniref:Multidrug resistance protein ABC transporter n=1 Tax=Phytophthora megakarya TaxID=4795 RepID=A0A225UWE5_9STRA|nr:LOW QUALITY PROTEIN: Multidrug resistance protein ABC transporter [Phytophthora megakarya]